jgi:hypothetical protein
MKLCQGVPSIVGEQGLMTMSESLQHLKAILFGHAILYRQILVGNTSVIIHNLQIKNCVT